MTKKEIKYADAIEEIENILQQLESGELDVDDLAGKVERVTYLIKLCRTRLQTTETRVNKILEEDLDENSED
jgi:exodeoxyribonuclease VII small subunit